MFSKQSFTKILETPNFYKQKYCIKISAHNFFSMKDLVTVATWSVFIRSLFLYLLHTNKDDKEIPYSCFAFHRTSAKVIVDFFYVYQIYIIAGGTPRLGLSLPGAVRP
jgi:hypothetical protein